MARHMEVRGAWCVLVLGILLSPMAMAQDSGTDSKDEANCVECAMGPAGPGGPGGGGNSPPGVYVTAPTTGQGFTEGSVVTLKAMASDANGIDHVEFLVDGAFVGSDDVSPYTAPWTATAGSHTIQARAYDNLLLPGMSTNTVSITVTANQAPSVSLTAPSNGANYTTGNTVAMSATASDADGSVNRVEFLVDGTEVAQDTSSPYTANWTATTGNHTLQARAVDNLGKPKSTSAITIHVTPPNQAPSVSLTAPSNGQSFLIGTAVQMSATASDSDGSINRVEFLVDGAEVGQDTTSPYSFNWTATAGSHTVQARAYDNDGAPKTSGAITITGVANQAPSVTLTEPDGGEHYITGTVVGFTATASDADGSVNRVEFLVNGTEVGQDTSSPYGFNWTATNGSHTITARAVDNLGKPTTSAGAAITVAANQAPSVSLTTPSNGAQLTAGATVALTATASDSDGSINRVEFLVDGVEVAQDTSSPYSVNWTALGGSHTIQARAIDNLGKPATTAAITVHGAIAPVVASATRTYVYNQYQELCKVIEPEIGPASESEDGATLMGYDAAGNLAWSATGLPAGTACDLEGDTAVILARKAVRSYDARNRITALDFADGQADVDYTYTAAGQLASITAINGGSNVVTTAYTYNRRGLPTRERMTWNTIDWSITHGYTANGHLATLGYPGSVSVAYAPNALGQPTQAGSYASNVSYYPNGAMQSFTYGNGIVHTLTRNARGLPDRSLDAYGSTKILDDGYDYDANGNVAAISDGATGRNQRGNRTMSYDGLDRLVAVQSPMYGATGTAYGYDSLDNLRHVVAPGRDHHYCYDGNNRLTNIKTGGCSGTTVIGLGYDVQGNLANKNGVTYTFDHGNRLRGVSSPASSYVYDGHGRRVRDITGGPRYSLYGMAGQLVFAQNGRDTSQYWYISLNGSLVATRERNYSTNVYATTYQHTDALGSPVAVTDASRTVIQRSEYEPYGKLVNRAMEDGPGYTGHMTDAATGLVYMQQRYYDPTIDGRFPSVDPVTAISPGGTFNRYWYANANPYRFTDPDGRKVKSYQLNTCGVTGCNEGSFNVDDGRRPQTAASPLQGQYSGEALGRRFSSYANPSSIASILTDNLNRGLLSVVLGEEREWIGSRYVATRNAGWIDLKHVLVSMMFPLGSGYFAGLVWEQGQMNSGWKNSSAYKPEDLDSNAVGAVASIMTGTVVPGLGGPYPSPLLVGNALTVIRMLDPLTREQAEEILGE